MSEILMMASTQWLQKSRQKKFQATVSGDQFFHNEYRFTGQKFTTNICQIWKLNMFQLVDQFEKVGWIIDPCNLKKVITKKSFFLAKSSNLFQGPYHITNFNLNPDVYPKFTPKGKWRVNVKVNHENFNEILFVRWYFELK